MRTAAFFVIVALLALAQSVSVSAADYCIRSADCMSCGYFPETSRYECAKVYRDAHCDCEQLVNGCELSGTCDYVGSEPPCAKMGTCPDQPFRLTTPHSDPEATAGRASTSAMKNGSPRVAASSQAAPASESLAKTADPVD